MSKANKQQVPKIRFTGFSEDLVSMEFREFTKLSQGLQISIDKRFLEPGDSRVFYITNEFLNPNSEKKFYIENPPKSVIANEEDILMTRTGNTGKVVTNVSGAYHNNFFKIAYDKTVDKDYLFYLLNEPRIQSEILARAGSSTIPDLNHSDFYSLKGMYPNKKEQTQIGNFFQQIDKLIELQTRAVESAETYKKAMLQKMFPQKGEKVPRVRFEGFSEDWVEKALSRIVNISSGVTGDTSLSKGKYFVTRIETIADGVINFNKVGFLNEKPDDRFLLVKGDILYSNINSLNHIGKVALFNDDKELYHGINLLRLIPMKDKIEPLFLFISMLTKDKLDWAKRHANQAVSQASINQTTLGQQYFYLPSILEQTQIGNFFQKLDQNIEAQKQKLEKYRDMKKALLQRMFV